MTTPRRQVLVHGKSTRNWQADDATSEEFPARVVMQPADCGIGNPDDLCA